MSLPYRQTCPQQREGAEMLESLSAAIERIKTAPDVHMAAILRSCAAQDDLTEIEKRAADLRARCRHVLLVGSGGSSLSGKALAALAKPSEVQLHVIDHTDPVAVETLLQALPLAETGALLISKSGHTVETLAVAAVLFDRKEAHDLPSRALAITVAADNPLRRFAQAKSIAVLDHDPDLCGRFAALSAVGLLPAALLGLDIRALRQGARRVIAAPEEAARGAVAQTLAMRQGAAISVLMAYGKAFSGLATWYRQSWAESLGKQGLGSTPYASFGPADQHSQLQLYLDGPRNKFFTLLAPETKGQGPFISLPEHMREAAGYLHGRRLGDVLAAEARATYESLLGHQLPVRLLEAAQADEESLGALFAHFMLEIIFTASLIGVNPFDQPAVEESKERARRYLAEQAS